MWGTVGAIIHGASQLGSAVGVAAFNAIKTSVEEKTGGPTFFTGRAAALWFVLAIVCVEAVSLLVFYRVDVERKIDSIDVASTTSGKLHEAEEITIREKIGVEILKEVGLVVTDA